MLIIATAATLAHVLNSDCDPGLTPILKRYQPMLGDQPMALLFILQPGDEEGALATLRGHPFELWEFILAEPGWFEAVFVYGQDGSGHVVLIPDNETIDPTLLAICREHAVPNG